MEDMVDTGAREGGATREAKTWLFIALALIALMMFFAGFVLVMT